MVSKGLLTFVVISAFVLLCNGAVLKNGQSRGSEETDDWSYECDAYWCDDDDGLSTGLIVGIVIAGLVITVVIPVVACFVCACCCFRYRRVGANTTTIVTTPIVAHPQVQNNQPGTVYYSTAPYNPAFANSPYHTATPTVATIPTSTNPSAPYPVQPQGYQVYSYNTDAPPPSYYDATFNSRQQPQNVTTNQPVEDVKLKS